MALRQHEVCPYDCTKLLSAKSVVLFQLNQKKQLSFSNSSQEQQKQNSSQIDSLRKTITRQLVSHIRSEGITNVRFREEMAKRLQELANKGYSVESLKQAFEESNEMAEIRAEAIANGTFMLAPNGKPTNLNERQWLQVRTN